MDHILPVLENKEDQTITRVTGLLDLRYRRSRSKKVEEAIEDLFRFREDDYEEDDALMLVMRAKIKKNGFKHYILRISFSLNVNET